MPDDFTPGPRPTFETAREFALWSLNASDLEVTMDLKMRAMQCLLALEGKAPIAKPDADADTAATALYAPRKVRGFGVVNGSRA